jgi:hypothetical protein
MDCFASLAMTVHLSARVSASRRRLIQMSNNQEGMHPHSRGAMRPSFAGTNRGEEGAGKAGVLAAPMARLQQKKQAAVTTGSANHPAFPAQWF